MKEKDDDEEKEEEVEKEEKVEKKEKVEKEENEEQKVKEENNLSKDLSVPKKQEKENEIKNDDCIYEIEKNPEWDKLIPHILEEMDKKKNDNSVFSEYPYFRLQNAVQYLPKFDKPSEILNTIQIKELHSRLPSYHQFANLYKIFSISVDGTSLKTLYNKCEGINNSVLIIKDDEGNIFGAYASEEYAPSSKFFGTGECFLFTFYKEDKIHIFCSTGINDNYMYCDDDQISYGCSDDYFSLCLRNNLLDGYSKYTQTYKNEPLNNKDKFVIYKLEIFGFKHK